MSSPCISGGLRASWKISISTFQYRRGNRNAYKLQWEQECRGAGSALSTFHKPISADDLGSSGLENRRGAWRESAYLRSISGPNEGYFIPARMEMYFADKLRPNWQLMVTLGGAPAWVGGGGRGRGAPAAIIFFLIRHWQSHQRTNNTPEMQPTVSEGRPARRDGFCMTICISNEDISWQSRALLQQAHYKVLCMLSEQVSGSMSSRPSLL